MIVALLSLAALVQQQADGPLVGGVPYERRATRAETEQAMRAALQPETARWGDWYLLAPFPYGGEDSGDMALALPPEAELARMKAEGAGPDLGAVWEGKAGVEARWQPLGRVDGRPVDLLQHVGRELCDGSLAYLWGTVESDGAQAVDVTLGTDDGVRLWLNGVLLLDHDVPRGLDPDDERLTLRLEPGLNHLLVKVTNGVGDWAFQINSREPLSGRVDALLQYQLDQDFPPSPERAHYTVLTVPEPDGVALEVGGLAFLDDGRPVVATRRGDVWLVDGAYAVPPVDASYTRFASGLHEPLGAAVRPGAGSGAGIYLVQRGELTRLVDLDGDDRAELYETVSDGWGVSGNYHEFAFGPKFDREGNAWVTLNVGFCGSLGKSLAPWRGWALKITPDGEVIPVCDGLRSPNGIGMNADGEMFYVDNQGDYVATNRLSHLAPGSWHGHPASLRWRDDLADPGQRPPREPAAVWFPYGKMGQSAADIALDETGGAFGPFEGQLFVGDQTLASVMRVDLEQVDGVWQGACFPFLGYLDCGVNRLAFAPDGSLFVGETDRGWGSLGRRPSGLQRVVYTGETPFEIRTMRATEDGFLLTFTTELDPGSATDPASYALSSFTYAYQASYGAPEIDARELTVAAAEWVDARTIRLRVDGLRAGYVHELHADGVRSASTRSVPGRHLLHPEAYYTLQRIPGQELAEPAADLPRALFLTHAAGYAHEVVTRPDPYVLSTAEERLVEAARGRLRVEVTQDCSAISSEKLSGVDVVVFYTSGELPIPADGRDALFAWVRGGGGFVGVHSAADTLYEDQRYGALLGGVFDGHPWTGEVGVRVEAPDHPAVASLGAGFAIEDEIYQFRDFERFPTDVLLSLDTATVDAALGARADGDYALAWVRPHGEGRVFYTALGHGAGVWSDERFLEHLVAGIEWAARGPLHSPPPPAGALPLFFPHGTARHDSEFRLVAGEGNRISNTTFGDALIHVEFRVPPRPEDRPEGPSGNSGVYVHGRYEVQVLDTHGSDPPRAGDCGALYGIAAPATNAARPAGVWQSYDIRFRAPRFDGPDGTGAKTEDARISVWHNGILVQDDVALPGPTPGGVGEDEVAVGPLMLQDHGDPVAFRNVWVLPMDAVER